MINKFYITDLAPGRSMIEYLVSQGHQVFVISWRNPDARHRDWDLDSYGSAIASALGAVRSICQAPKVSICELCSGGVAAAMVAAHLSAVGKLGELGTLCLGVTVLDQAQAGTAAAMIDRRTAALAMAASRSRGYLDGSSLAEVFAWLRPNDRSGTTGSTTTCRARRRRRSTSSTGTPTPPGCPPLYTGTSSRLPCPTR